MELMNIPYTELDAESTVRPWKFPTNGLPTNGRPTNGRPHAFLPSLAPLDPDNQGRGRLAPFLNLLRGMLEASPSAKIKEFHDILRAQGYGGSYDSVKKRIQALRREMGCLAGKIFDSSDSPQAQVELSRIVLKSEGGEAKAHLFTMYFGYSGCFFAELIDVCDMAGFLQCHRNAFEFLGGVPKLVYYDPQENPTLRKLVGGYPFHLPVVNCGQHYGYGVEATPMFAPWMKGRLKRPGKVLKKFFFPKYAFSTLESANRDIGQWIRVEGESVLRHADPRRGASNLGLLPPESFNFRSRQPALRLRS